MGPAMTSILEGVMAWCEMAVIKNLSCKPKVLLFALFVRKKFRMEMVD